MKSVLVFGGEENFLIENAILKICDKYNDGQVIKYDLLETNISSLIEDASMNSLFNEHKIIIGYNASFLSGVKEKQVINHDIEGLSSYIDNPNPDTTMILITNDKLDRRKNIVKKLLTKALVKEFNKLTEDEMLKFAKENFNKDNYQITFKALNMLIDRVCNNLYLLNNECEKLKLYKLEDKTINEQDIEQMIIKYDFDNIFALTDAVIKKDITNALYLYKELLKRNEEPIKIIVLLANQFRLIFQVKRLRSKGFNEGQIANDLGVHPYRVKIASEVKLEEKELLKYLKLLADLDENIKLGKVNKDVGLELFLLSL